jgi:hypothetical protein
LSIGASFVIRHSCFVILFIRLPRRSLAKAGASAFATASFQSAQEQFSVCFGRFEILN